VAFQLVLVSALTRKPKDGVTYPNFFVQSFHGLPRAGRSRCDAPEKLELDHQRLF
jgi:hypothetical protein